MALTDRQRGRMLSVRSGPDDRPRARTLLPRAGGDVVGRGYVGVAGRAAAALDAGR